MKETWKQISGTTYLVSDLGRVHNTKTDTTLKPWFSSTGYPFVGISVSGAMKKRPIHRLVAEAFIPNPENKPCIDHINTITTDNRVENLRWVTHEENSQNPITIKRLKRTTFKAGDNNPKTMTGKFGLLSPVARPVLQMLKGNVIREFECAREAMRETGIDCGSITKCCRKQRKTAGGYGWAYKQKEGAK